MRSQLLAASLITIIAIGCSDDPPAAPDLTSKFDGQLVALLPFDAANPACDDDPFSMTPETLSSCADIDPTKASSVVLTMDLSTFDLHDEKSVYVFRGPSLDPNKTDGWIGIIGLGAIPGEGASGPLLTSHIRPKFVMAAPLLYYGAVALLAAGTTWYAGKAIVATNQALMERRRAQQLTEQSEKRLVEQQSELLKKTCEGGVKLTCDPEKMKEFQERKNNACNAPRSCSMALKCSEIQDNVGKNSECLTARARIRDVCCGGQDGPIHQKERDSVQNALTNCQELLTKVCGKNPGS